MSELNFNSGHPAGVCCSRSVWFVEKPSSTSNIGGSSHPMGHALLLLQVQHFLGPPSCHYFDIKIRQVQVSRISDNTYALFSAFSISFVKEFPETEKSSLQSWHQILEDYSACNKKVTSTAGCGSVHFNPGTWEVEAGLSFRTGRVTANQKTPQNNVTFHKNSYNKFACD